MANRIVNIHADGKLAYSGYAERAAKRLDISEAALAACINAQRNIVARQPRLTYVDGEGLVKYRAKAQSYVASFRQ